LLDEAVGGVAVIVHDSSRTPPRGVGSIRRREFRASTATSALLVPSSGTVRTTWRVRVGRTLKVEKAL
jgi:hypothetical protein